MRVFHEQEIEEIKMNMQSILSNLEQECSNLQTQILLREKALDDLKEENEGLRSQLEGKRDHHSTDPQEFNRLTEEIRTLQLQNEDLQFISKDLGNKNDALKDQYNRLEIEYRSLYESHLILLEQNQSLNERNSELTAELDALRRAPVQIFPSVLNSNKYFLPGNYSEPASGVVNKSNSALKSPATTLSKQQQGSPTVSINSLRMSNYLSHSRSDENSFKSVEKSGVPKKFEIASARFRPGQIAERPNNPSSTNASPKYPEFEENFDSQSVTSNATDNDQINRGPLGPRNKEIRLANIQLVDHSKFRKQGEPTMHQFKLNLDEEIQSIFGSDSVKLGEFKVNCLKSQGKIFENNQIQVDFHSEDNSFSDDGFKAFSFQIKNISSERLHNLEVTCKHHQGKNREICGYMILT
jgi:hypothetical protein